MGSASPDATRGRASWTYRATAQWGIAETSASVIACFLLRPPRLCAIVAKNLDKQDICPNLSLDLRPLTNELGGRLDYGQPCCLFHSWCRCINKAFTSILSLHACNSTSLIRRAMLLAALISACAS